MVLQMVSYFILSVSSSFSSMSSRIEMIGTIQNEDIIAKEMPLSRSAFTRAYCLQRLCVRSKITTLNYETQNVSLQSFRVLKINVISLLPRLLIFFHFNLLSSMTNRRKKSIDNSLCEELKSKCIVSINTV